jgi:uncharacterized spore protein YtfJ
MDVQAAVARVEDMVRVNRVYSEPVTVDGLTVIPAARVGGGMGGGTGRDPEAGGEGSGGGLGWTGRPAGAFVLKQGSVRWEPAVDVNRLVVAVTIVAVTALLTARRIVTVRSAAGRSGTEPDE